MKKKQISLSFTFGDFKMLFLGVKVGVFRPSLEEPSPIKSNDESSSVSSTKQKQRKSNKKSYPFDNFNKKK